MDAAEIQRRAGDAVDGVRTMARRVTDNPIAALLTALAAGFVLGLVLRVTERPRHGTK